LFSAALVVVMVMARESKAGWFTSWPCQHTNSIHACEHPGCLVGDVELSGEAGGTWYWLRSPEDERRVIIGLYNRYCIRCHGVDGRGVWDIPDVPDFTNGRWQSCRSDGQLTRAILEGRGACMPPFRGTLTLEEACAMARYLRTFVPGTELSKPDVGQNEKPEAAPQAPTPRKVEQLPK
jgi:hypothetical protein